MTSPATRRGKTFQALVAEAKANIQEIDQDMLKAWQKEGRDMVLIDVREPADFDMHHIAGAINIPRGLLELDIEGYVPNQDTPVVCYCGGGSRSALAAQTLHTMGYAPVYSLRGGFRVWIED
jgi:rhodanese-related sulfurtransferase